MTPERRLALFGTAEPPPATLSLQAGALTLDLVDGAVGTVTRNGVEILRGIAFLIRDEAWGTPAAELEPLAVETRPDGFRVAWRGRIAVAGAAFAFTARLEGDPDGHLLFAVEGAADADLKTNRAGFVLLHPAGFAGLPVTLHTVDGGRTDAVFPTVISPGQPFFDLRALEVRLDGVGRVTCRMEASLPGDPLGRFETEDQRNWGDASYKTYVGSLLDPWPYVLQAGRPLAQRIGITVEPEAPQARVRSRSAPAAAAVPAPVRLPVFGLGVPHGLDRADPADRDRVAALGLRRLVVEADLRRPGVEGHLRAAAALAARTRADVQVELVTPAASPARTELEAAARLLAAAGLAPESVLVCPAPLLKSYQPVGPWPDIEPLEAWYAAARAAFPGARLGGGMLTNFTELNRKRPDPSGLDFISHTTTAIVHAADDRSVMETLETLPQIAASVAVLWPGLPYRLGPSSIAMRSNPYGATLPENPGWTRMPLADRDPRHRALFGAAWTVGYVAALVPSALEAIALHASHGPLGLGEGARLFPVFHVMAALAEASGREAVALDLPKSLAGLAWRGPAGTTALVANPTAEPADWPFAARPARVLDAASLAPAGADPAWIRAAPTPAPARLDAFAVALVAIG
ncbi:hypothetical protein [Prosthecomicrobium sp. N25]|uniref:hypothetical protein n=1 Tax=Prosthecomicrobium sp. N25 TaxID=3129254 RepID=UPI003076FBBD